MTIHHDEKVVTANSDLITKEIHDGVTSYVTTRKGTKYCAYFMESVGEWWVSSQRIALGRYTGNGRYYKDLSECKPFAALPTLIKLNAI